MEMSDAIIVAIITGVFAIIGNFIVSHKQTNDLYAKLDKQFSVQDKELEGKVEVLAQTVNIRLDELTREVREHNNFAKRMPVVEEQIKVANHRIADLEAKTK